MLLFYEVEAAYRVRSYDVFLFSIDSHCFSLVLLELDHRCSSWLELVLFILLVLGTLRWRFYLLWFVTDGLTSAWTLLWLSSKIF